MKNKVDTKQQYGIERHLYFVTEDRGNTVYLWDYTAQSRKEFKLEITSEELLKVAKEGAMLVYKNGEYKLYSENGYDIISRKR